MLTPAPGWQVDPNNPNGVIPVGSGATVNNLNYSEPTSTPSVISSDKGAEIVTQKTQTLNQLSSTPTTPTTSTDTTKTTTPTTGTGGTVTPAPTSTKVTLINPDTEQTVTYEDAAINRENIQGYLDAGYKLSEASGALPSWLQPNGVSSGQTDLEKAQASVDQASTDLKTLTDNLTKFTVSDADLAAQTAGIAAQWNARIADMQRINAQREGSINTLGIRLGSRYAGGSGGTFGGIVSEEERQGVQRIADLEGQKQSAIAAAKAAALSQNWSVYSKQVDLAEKAYSDKVTALKDLQTATAAQNKIIADEAKAAADDARQQEKDHYDQVIKPMHDTLAAAAKNGAPKEVQDAISNAPDVASAIAAAGEYLQDVPTSGIVGEYLFYAKQAKLAGQTPVDFNEYQNIDANRKKSIAKAGVASANGLNNQTLTKVESVANQFDGEQIVKDYNITATQVNYIKNLGSTPTEDMARVYAFAKVMDPNSVVRESEYKTVQDYSQAVLQAAGLKAKRVFTNAGFLTPEARSFISSTLEKKLQTQYKTYSSLSDEYGRRIDKLTGASDGKEYISDYSKGYDTSGTLIQSEEKSKQTVTDYGASNPEVRQKILSLAGVPQPSLGGRAYTWQEIQQILGI